MFISNRLGWSCDISLINSSVKIINEIMAATRSTKTHLTQHRYGRTARGGAQYSAVSSDVLATLVSRCTVILALISTQWDLWTCKGETFVSSMPIGACNCKRWKIHCQWDCNRSRFNNECERVSIYEKCPIHTWKKIYDTLHFGMVWKVQQLYYSILKLSMATQYLQHFTASIV